MSTRQGGFTLLEMLVALTVFALVSAMVYGGQTAVLKMKAGTERQALLLKQLQQAMLMLERDLSQHVLRPVRDEYGDGLSALATSDHGDYRISLTRAGWSNPLGQPRSTLQRVAYGVTEERLWRYSWHSLDRAQGSEPYRVALLDGVQELTFRFLDGNGEWQTAWPPLAGGQTGEHGPATQMPRAVELTLELTEGGSFRRVIPMAEGV